MNISPSILALLVTSLLLTTPGTAQQIESEESGTAKPASKAETEKPVSNTSDSKKPRAATRFIPTEKIHADDAVSFPVDI